MKIFAFLFLATLGLVQARSILKKSDPLISVTVGTGHFSQAVNAYANAWALDSTNILQLPITQSELVNVQYIEYTGTASNKNTKSPNFGFVVGVPPEWFNEQSYLALEVYDNSTSPPTYIGGNIATVAQVQQLPHSYQLELFDRVGYNAGELYISWV